jgi:hypothetical protein
VRRRELTRPALHRRLVAFGLFALGLVVPVGLVALGLVFPVRLVALGLVFPVRLVALGLVVHVGIGSVDGQREQRLSLGRVELERVRRVLGGVL